jgi:phosphoribosyl-AMP cyclohydrolase
MIRLDFEKAGGLIPAIAQDYETGEILMLAYMNPESWEATLATRKATYWSRSRRELWVKGLTSGNVQHVKEIRIDCDDDAILLKVEQVGGAACHTGHRSCFFKKVENGGVKIIGKPVFDPREVYKK